MVLRKIGEGVTNSEGIAVMNKDAQGQTISGYTGVGAGEIDIVAKCGGVVSEPTSVLDCLKYDKGILNDSETHDIYETRTASTRFERTNEYSKLTEVTSGTTATLCIPNLPTDCIIDFEYWQDGNVGQGGVNALYYNSEYKTYISLNNMGYGVEMLEKWVNLRLTLSEGSATLTSLDDPTKTSTKTYTGVINRMFLTTNADITEVRIRNVKVYSN